MTRDGAPALILNNSDRTPRYAALPDLLGRHRVRRCPHRPPGPSAATAGVHSSGPVRPASGSDGSTSPDASAASPSNIRALDPATEAAQQAHRRRDYPTALEHLKRVQQYAPNHVGARKGIETIRRHSAEADAARLSCESARARRHLVAARAATLTWGRLVPDDAADFVAARDEVARALRMAQSLAAKGRSIEAEDPKAARMYYDKAPTSPPTSTRPAKGSAAARPIPLRTSSPSSRSTSSGCAGPRPPDGLGPLKFRVVRKRGGIPAQPNDGAVVAEVAQAEVEDRGVKPGESVGYAVFATRGDAASKSAATAGPILVLPDVQNLRVEARSGEVALSWTLPDRASGVRVVRNLRRKPTHDQDGEALDALPTGAIDRGLDDDRAYHYAVFALYPGPDGGERASKGVAVIAVPHSPVEPRRRRP